MRASLGTRAPSFDMSPLAKVGRFVFSFCGETACVWRQFAPFRERSGQKDNVY